MPTFIPNSKDYIYTLGMFNQVTFQQVNVQRFQAEKFVFTVQAGNQRYRIFQEVFGKSDGSLYVTFPYFRAQEGLVSIGTFPRFMRSGQIDLEPKGKVTSHHVKYAHHPDGEVHFSQSGKVASKIRRKSFPLDKVEGHLFTINLQGLSSFETDPVTTDHLPKKSRITLNLMKSHHQQ